MDIVYVAEKKTIASLLSEYLQLNVVEDDIAVADNPEETGSFLIDWELHHFVLSPAGDLHRS